MRVLCVQTAGSSSGHNGDASRWLDLDAEYIVLEIYAYPLGRIEFRLMAKDGSTPALFDSSMFVTSDGRIPSHWLAQVTEGGLLRIGPGAWMAPGFWDAFFDRDPAAVRTFDAERQRLREQDP